MKFVLLLIAVLFNSSCAVESKKLVPTVAQVDLSSYMGLWYEVRRIKNRFQDNEPKSGSGPCFNTTAEYSLTPNGRIKVKNTCHRKSGVDIATANAQAVTGSNNSKLKVNFTGIAFLEWLGIGNGDYWVLALGEKNADNAYSWVLVGSPKLDYGWILSRTPVMAEEKVADVLKIAGSLGYDPKQFVAFVR